MINTKSGFTLMELMIVIAIVGLAGIFMFSLLNPFEQIHKARDSRRKKDLANLKVTIEDFYNNKNCYPKPTEICYDADVIDVIDIPCHICGEESNSPVMPNNISLPCDPSHPNRIYLYQTENSECPQWYRIYAKLQNEKDPIISQLVCSGDGCGPANGDEYDYVSPNYDEIFGYNYGVCSSNTDLERSHSFYCFTSSSTCDVCGNPPDEHPYQTCLNNCEWSDKIYSNLDACNEDNGL